MTSPPALVWFRRDLRLSDHPALRAALETGGPVIPVFVLDPETEAIGAAAKWRLGLSLAAFDARLRHLGSRLILRRGDASRVLADLARETGAAEVHWSRLYAPDTVARDRAVKARLRDDGLTATSHPGFLLHEPWTIETRAGGPFKVFTPFWKTIGPLGAPVVARHVCVGEAAARDRLDAFLDGPVARYRHDRNRPDLEGTSRLAENLTYGEISPRTIWHAALRARETGAEGTDAFLRELGWREFAWHLHWHAPDFSTRNWRSDWDGFPWRVDNAQAERWRRGLTGEPMVDAGMREMYVTGTMHNRVRMLVASYLTKHLLTDWRVGRAWFEDCLIDWDPASNALGWQWTAGSGPDAAPFFRIFNPALQAKRFDPEGAYRRRFLSGEGPPHADAAAYFDAVPRSWHLRPDTPSPDPLVDLDSGRREALAAYQDFRG